MSWLNTTSIANLAKNALKEAQKTIDKALDIRETEVIPKPIDNETLSKEIGHFFETFNLINKEDEPPDDVASNHVTNDGVVVIEPSSNKDSENEKIPQEELCSNVLDDENSRSQINSNKDMFNSAGNLEIKDSSFNELVLTTDYIEDSTNVSNSCYSSTSISSSVTVISPENFLVEMDWGSDTRSDAPIETDHMDSHQVKNSEEVVSTMLSEAMKDSAKTETSASAGDQSGDEIETTTSSDIEIIASPQAGIRKLIPAVHLRSNDAKTHSREPSEASSDGSVTSAGQDLEPHGMNCKIIQLNQLLEARDNQQIELTRKCSALTEEVDKLKSLLALDEKERTAVSEAIRRQTDDFAVRLSSVEKRYQQALAEREALAKKVEQVQQSYEAHGNLADSIREKDETIEQLRSEGEKLSKLHLQQSNIIKKLRTQEKEDETRCKQLKEQNEELRSEIERLNKCLSAKDELERNQIEVVRQLTSSSSQLEKELTAVKVMIREKVSEAENLRTELAEAEQNLVKVRADVALRDSAETERCLSAEVSLRQRLQLEYETSSRIMEDEKQALTMRCQELVHSLAEVECDRSKERERMQSEVSRLMHRLQDAEFRNDELSQALTSATKPLLRQIDTLQHALASQRLTEENLEKTFRERQNVIESQLLLAKQKEAADKDIYLGLQARIDEAAGKIETVKKENQRLLQQLEEERHHSASLEEARKRDSFTSDLVKSQLVEDVKRLQQKLILLENSFEKQTIALEEEKKKIANFSATRLQDKELEYQVFPTDSNTSSTIGSKSVSEIVSRSSSPTPSLGKLSLSGSFTESHSSNPWNASDEVFDGGLATPVPKSTLYDAMRAGSYTAVFESLQAQLKTRDGEVTQLQQELQNQEKSRDSLTRELTEIIKTNQELTSRLDMLEVLHVEFEDLKTKYNALLQMYGEKIEENEELRLDLLDVKEMYKAQIDQLMKM